MKRISAILTMLTLGLTSVATAQRANEPIAAVVPVVGSNAGAFGANFRTELQVHNPGAGMMTGYFVFRQQGRPGSAADPELEYTLAPFETRHYEDVVASMGATGLGSIDIVPTNGSGLPTVVFRAFDDQAEAGTTGVTVPMVRVEDALTPGRRSSLLAPADLGKFRFNIGVRTLDEPVRIRVRVFNSDGTEDGEAGERSYAPLYFEQRPAADFIGRPIEPNQSVEIEVLSGRAIVYGTVTDNVTNDGSIQIDESFNALPAVADPAGDGELLIQASTGFEEPVTIEATVDDADGDPLTYTLAVAPAHGTVSPITGQARSAAAVAAQGGFSITYTPAAGYVGADSFEIVIADDQGGSVTLVVRVSVGGSDNAAPVAINSSVVTDEDSPVSFALNATDADHDPLTIEIVSAPASGSLTGNGLNRTYRPAADFHGTIGFSFRASDGVAQSAIAVVTITVSPVNDRPDAASLSLTTPENIPVNVTLAGSDVDGDALAFRVVTGPMNGSLSGAAPNLIYTPAAGFAGTDVFTYVSSDGSLDSTPATVVIDVTDAGNSAPTADAQNLVTATDTPLTILLSGSDPDGDTLEFAVSTSPANGVLTGTAPNLTYTPNGGFSGNDAFTFSVSDGSLDSAPATISITVNAAGNSIPTANAQSVVTEQDTAVAIVLSGTDPDADPLSFNLVTGPSNGVLSGTAPNLTYTPNAAFSGNDELTFTVNDGTVDSAPATVSITVNAAGNAVPVAHDQSLVTTKNVPAAVTLTGTDADGDVLSFRLETGPTNGILTGTAPDLTFVPNTGFVGNDGFTFVVNDGTVDSALATVTITVNQAGNSVPVADAQTSGTVEDTPVVILLTGSDADGDPLTFDVVTTPTGGTLSGTAPNMTYTPGADFNGSDSFTFTVNDGTVDSAAATVVIEVAAANDAPVADALAVTTEEDVAVALVLTGSDVDGDSLTFSVVTNPANGTLSGTAPNLTYTPNADFNGTDNFTFTVNDATVDSAAATVTIQVDASNDAPVADARTVAADEDLAVVITLTGSDLDGDPLSFAIATGPANGVLSGTAPNLTYTPSPDFNGTDTFTFTVNDGTVDSPEGMVTINVAPANDVPVANDQNLGTTEDTPLAVVLSGSDVDGDTLSFAVVTSPANGILSGTAPNLTYTPNANFSGSDSFTFTINDGTVDSAIATITINVGGENDAPVADDQVVPTTEDAAVAIVLTGSDADGDSLAFTVTGGPANGVLSGTAPNLTYTPNANFNGTDSFTFVASDGTIDSIPATVTINVTAENDVPVADDQNPATTEDTPLALVLTGSDVDGDTLSFNVVTSPASGVLSGTAPNLTYTPNANFSGSDSFTFTVNDGTVNSAVATITINVASENDIPVADAQGIVTTEDTPIAVVLTGSDADGDTLTFSVIALPANGALTGTAPNVTYTPNANFDGSDSFTFTVNDGNVDSATATISISVNGVNDAPVFTSTPVLSATEGSAYVYDVTTIDVDAGDTRTITASTLPAWLAITDNGDGTASLTGTPGNGDVGSHGFDLVVTDLAGASALQSLTVSVANVNDLTIIDLDADDDKGTTGNDFAATFTEDGSAALLADTDASVTDIDDATIDHVTVTLTNLLDAGLETLDANVGVTAITKSYDSGTGVMLLQGPDTLANFESVIRTITYSNASQDPDTTSRVVTVVGSDLVEDGPAATVTITIVAQNDAPAVTSGATPSVAENTTAVATVTATDDEGDALSFSITGGVDQTFFTIDTTTGELSFGTAPDFDAAADDNGDNAYVVEITVSDGNGGDTSQTLTVSVTDVNEAPVLTSAAAVDAAENQTAVIDISATDPEGDTEGAGLSYAITGGADQLLFAIDSTSGVLTFSSAPDFETPQDADTDNVHEVEVTVTDSGAVTGAQTIQVTVTDVNEAPAITTAAALAAVENQTGVVDVDSSDPEDSEGSGLSYTITGGADRLLFSIDGSTGVLTFVSAPDFETPADADSNNVYEVEITVTDSGTLTGALMLNVTVTDGNDAPVITTGTSVNAAENQTAVVDVQSTDTEGDTEGSGLTYTLTGGADLLDFAIDANSGVLSFAAVPDFENPADADADNVYLVEITVTDSGSLTDVLTLSVTVTDANDVPAITSAATVSAAEAQTAVIDVQSIDPEGETEGAGLSYSISGGDDSGLFSIDTATGVLTFASVPDFENPGDANSDNDYLVEVTVSDSSLGTGSQLITVSVTDADEGPAISSGNSANFAENGVGTVLTVLAADPEADAVTYSITGGADMGAFSIGSTSGAIAFLASPDFENPADFDTNNAFVIEVTAASSGGTDVQTITITVTNVNEAPSITSASTANVNENTTGVMSVAAADPDAGATLTYSIVGGADSGDFAIVASTGVLTFGVAPNFEAPADSGSDNVYDVVVRASDGLLFDDQSIQVSVINVDEAPVLTTSPIAYDSLGNTQLRAGGAAGSGLVGTTDSGSILTKSAPVDPEGLTVTVVPIAGGASTNGGSVDVASDGTFTYTSAAAFTGADSFTVQVTDGVNPVNLTVNLTVTNTVWYVRDIVDAQNAVGGDGRSTNAFDSIAALNAATTTDDDYIFLYRGNSGTTPYSGSIALRNGQKLYGEGVGLTVPVFGTLVPAGQQPRIVTVSSVDVVGVLANTANGNRMNVEIRGLDITAGFAGQSAIDVTTANAAGASVTIANNTISGSMSEGIDVNQGSTGSAVVTIASNNITASGNGLDAARTVGTLRLGISTNTVHSGGTAINVSGGSTASSFITAFSDNVINGDTSGSGIVISNATFDATPGAPYDQVAGGVTAVGVSGNSVGGAGMMLSSVAGDLAFSDLDIYASNGTGLLVSGAGAVDIAAGAGTRVTVPAGVAVIEATGGPAVNLSGMTADLQLSSLKSTSTTSSGVSLTNVSDGTTNAVFSAGSGSTITTTVGATGPIFNVSGGNLDIAYGGTIVNSSPGARAVSLTTWSGDDGMDDITLSGSITESGAGILVNGNSGTRPITFSGGMTINTTTGEGFAATSNTNSGGLNVTGTNTVNSTSATAVRISNTVIASTHVTFHSVSAGNNTAAGDPANGIVIDTTGSSGSFRVLGTGSASTGGTIQNTTGHAISLNNTLHPQFSWMSIQNAGRSGVDGNAVTNFTFNNSTINNAGTAAAGQYDESNISFNDNGAFTASSLSGTVSITNNTLTNARRHGIQIENGTGTISNLTIQNNVLTSSTSGASSLGTAILVLVQGSAATQAHLTTGTISNNTISNFPSGEGIAVLGGSGNSTNINSSTLGGSGTPINITGNSINGGATRMGSNAIRASFNGQVGVANFNISSNPTITNIQGQGISVFMGGSVTGTTTISNNTIVANQTLAAGTQGMAFQLDDGPAGLIDRTPNYNLLINSNNVSNYEGTGIRVITRKNRGQLDATVQNNVVGTPILTNRNGIRIDGGLNLDGDTSLCLLMNGNTSDGSGIFAGIGIRKQGTDANVHVFGISGLAPSPTTGANAAAKIAADNPAGGGVDHISGDNFVNCTTTP